METERKKKYKRKNWKNMETDRKKKCIERVRRNVKLK
jgi:hypothetical protein